MQINIFFFFFCREKISLSGTPISLPNIADLPIWAQENITCMLDECQKKEFLKYMFKQVVIC